MRHHVQHRQVTQSCSGTEAACSGSSTDPAWETLEDCQPEQECASDGITYAVCQTCTENASCVSGSCTCDYLTCGGNCCPINSGECRIYLRQCGFTGRVTADDGVQSDQFGKAVAISGDYAIVGAPLVGEQNTGAAYIFQKGTTRWEQAQKLTAEEPVDRYQFGYSVAIDGDYAVVGTQPEEIGGGFAYVFHRTQTAWEQIHKFSGDQPRPWDNYGISVAIRGDYIIVGASEGETDIYDGSAYIYHRTDQTWELDQKIQGDDVTEVDSFGRSVAIDGAYAVVGAPCYNSTPGFSYVFKKTTDEWEQIQKLEASDAQAKDHFGHSVAISGDYIVIGARGEDGGDGDPHTNLGAAYVYRHSEGVWLETTRLQGDYRSERYFGGVVSIRDQFFVVAAPEIESFGSFHLYVIRETDLEHFLFYDEAASSISTDGQAIISGGPFREQNTGAIYFF